MGIFANVANQKNTGTNTPPKTTGGIFKQIADKQKGKSTGVKTLTGKDNPVGSLPVIKQLTEFGIGLGTNIAKAGLGLGKFASKTVGQILSSPTSRKTGQPLFPESPAKKFFSKTIPENIDTIQKDVFTDPYKKELATIPGKAGEITGDVAAFAEGGKPIVAAQEKLAPLAEKVPTTIGKYLAKKTAQVVPEAAVTGGIELAKSGGDTKSAKEAAIGAGIFSGLTHIGADAVKSIIPQTVKDNFARVLNYAGKTSLTDSTGQKLNNAVSAFTTIKNLAPEIKVIDKNGIEKVFDPSKADFGELPQALGQAKDKIYNAYSDLANKAGEEGANFGQADFKAVMDKLDQYSGKGYTEAFSNKAKQIKEAIKRFGTLNEKDGETYFKNTSPKEIQDLIQNINKDVNPLSDKAGAEVSQEASQELRRIMDEKITKATGSPEYQKLRTAYSQLKGIEKDVLNNWKRAMRKAGVSSSVIDGIATVDTLQGVLTQSPTETVRGTLIGTVKKAYDYLRDPEVNLRRAFKMLDDQEKGIKPSTTTKRLFGSSQTKP